MKFEIERTPTERLVIESSTYKGHELVSLRIYYLADEDEWRPTKKGVTFKWEQFDEVLDALTKIKNEKPNNS